jgi:hypothetical protein
LQSRCKDSANRAKYKIKYAFILLFLRCSLSSAKPKINKKIGLTKHQSNFLHSVPVPHQDLIVEVEVCELHGGEIETVGDFNAEVLHIHRVHIKVVRHLTSSMRHPNHLLWYPFRTIA